MAAAKIPSLFEVVSEDVKCAVCLSRFKNPRALSCLHSFCEKCLETFQAEKGSAGSIPCPICQQLSHIPEGGVTALTVDFRAMKLIQVLECEEGKDGTKLTRLPIGCDICGRAHARGQQPHGYIHCSDCAQTMCKQCGSTHSKMKGTQNHTVMDVPEQVLGGLEGNGAKTEDVFTENESSFCQNHAESELRLFCTACNVPICDECIESDHRTEDSHEHVLIDKFVSTLKEKLSSQVTQVDDKLRECASFISMLDTIDKSAVMQEEVFNKKIKVIAERETRMWEKNVKATRNSFLHNHHQELNDLRRNSREVKENLVLCDSEARKILKQELSDLAVARSYQKIQPLLKSIEKAISERLDLSLLQKISESLSQQLHFHKLVVEPGLGSLVVAFRDKKIIHVHSCTGGPYSMTFTRDGRLAVVAQFQEVTSQEAPGKYYTNAYSCITRKYEYTEYNTKLFLQKAHDYYAVKQTEMSYASTTCFSLETRVTERYTSVASLSDYCLVLMNGKSVITQPGGRILLNRYFRSIATDLADNIYVTYDNQIDIFVRGEGVQKSITVRGLKPHHITVCPRRADGILVTHNLSKISVVDEDGNILRTITHPEWEEVAIGCDNERSLYVLWEGASGLRTLQRYTLEGYLFDTLFEKEEHGCDDLILSVSPDGTAAVVTNTGSNAEVTIVSTNKKLNLQECDCH